MASENTSTADLSLDPVIREAKDRFETAKTWENQFRVYALDDLKIANADSYNGYQWPNNIRSKRDIEDRPSLTINKIRQHNLKIINDAKQNKPGIHIRPTGNQATAEAAEVLEDLIRHIEYQSNASVHYDTATKFQVQIGIGYWKVVTRYAGDDTFDQEIYIEGIDDPFRVYIDPDTKEVDRSDAEWAFIFSDVPKEQFDKLYPSFKDDTGQLAIGGADMWITQNHIRVADYYRRIKRKTILHRFTDPETGQPVNVKENKLARGMLEVIKQDPAHREREVEEIIVEWFLLIGNKVAKRKTWAGTTIPIVAVVGEETKIEGKLDRKGHTRAMVDPQRMYNYWSSSATENVALQSKTPWVGPAEAFEEYESYWKTANKVNHAYLPYNHKDEDGEEIPPPTRAPPPIMPDAYLKGMQVSATELMMVSGQYESQMGEQGNERSGKAIQQRQRQGDNATYHFVDNQAIAIRRTGKIILELIPVIYSDSRVVSVLAEDGTSYDVEIDPAEKKSFLSHKQHTGEVIKRILNPKVGKFEVMADVGPGYATKREEAFNALVNIITQAPNLVGVIGDILIRMGDFPMADEAAARLKRMIPRQALGLGPTANEQQLQAQVQQLQNVLQKTMDQYAHEKIKLKGKDQMRDIDTFNALTNRLKVLLDQLSSADPNGTKSLIIQTLQEALGVDISSISVENAPDTQDEFGGKAPILGAEKAPDGKWYIPDHARPGKFLWLTNGG